MSDYQFQEGETPCGPWVSLMDEKRGLILFRLRLKGKFNLVERLFKPDFKGSTFLEGKIDTNIGIEWGEDFDVRKKGSLSINQKSSSNSQEDSKKG